MLKLVLLTSFLCSALDIPPLHNPNIPPLYNPDIPPLFNPVYDVQWQAFKQLHTKDYSADEENAKRLIFQSQALQIINHNLEADQGKHSYRRGVNVYSDVDHKTFNRTMNGFRASNRTGQHRNIFLAPSNVQLPDIIDWRLQDLLTPIKDQQQCGSCWSFSTTGALEGQLKKKTGKLVSLSEQNLVDCTGEKGNFGCNGGSMDVAFEYVKENNGIETEKSYPYTAQVGGCHFNMQNVGGTCTGYVDIPSGDEAALQVAVATIGPISVAVDASQEGFMQYKSGIYDEPNCNSQNLNHAVLAVGYGSENSVDYWIIKNSWGTSWGENGFMKLPRNRNNQCGIATQASYPLV